MIRWSNGQAPWVREDRAMGMLALFFEFFGVGILQLIAGVLATIFGALAELFGAFSVISPCG